MIFDLVSIDFWFHLGANTESSPGHFHQFQIGEERQSRIAIAGRHWLPSENTLESNARQPRRREQCLKRVTHQFLVASAEWFGWKWQQWSQASTIFLIVNVQWQWKSVDCSCGWHIFPTKLRQWHRIIATLTPQVERECWLFKKMYSFQLQSIEWLSHTLRWLLRGGCSVFSRTDSNLDAKVLQLFLKLFANWYFYLELQVFDDESKLMAHSVKHKGDSMSGQESDPSQKLMQNFVKQMAKQSENMFNMESFMNPAASVISNLAALNQNQMAMGGEGYSFNDQLSTQIQTLCLAQLAALYQNNPMMYQHLYPLLGAVEQMKQQDPQRMFMPPAANQMPINNPFGAFDLSSLGAASNVKKATSAPAKLQKQGSKLGKNDAKTARAAASGSDMSVNRNAGNFKIFKDEPIPKGYLKFRFNEDCGFTQCGYSNLQSHFHCCRTDCHYSFCDKTRFVQHTARHERLDKLMGDDFKQYRANMSCGHDDCVYKNNLGNCQFLFHFWLGTFFNWFLIVFFVPISGANNKSSHFHCLKCDFICSDTNKVVAHRRHHSKLEYIRTVGFRKVANNEPCHVQSKRPNGDNSEENTTGDDEHGEDSNGTAGGECIYSMKQTHYHCLVCDCSVLSRAQLNQHQHK